MVGGISGTMFRLLPGIFDIVPLQEKSTDLKAGPYKGNMQMTEEGE